jgi:hypothetical protein
MCFTSALMLRVHRESIITSSKNGMQFGEIEDSHTLCYLSLSGMRDPPCSFAKHHQNEF